MYTRSPKVCLTLLGADVVVLVWSELVLCRCMSCVLVMEYGLAHDRDNEKAYVSVNDKICWNKTLANAQGSQQCGSTISTWLEDSVAAQCAAEPVGGKLTVRVYSDLDGGGTEESFAIDNVTVMKISTGVVVCFSVEVLPRTFWRERVNAAV